MNVCVRVCCLCCRVHTEVCSDRSESCPKRRTWSLSTRQRNRLTGGHGARRPVSISEWNGMTKTSVCVVHVPSIPDSWPHASTEDIIFRDVTANTHRTQNNDPEHLYLVLSNDSLRQCTSLATEREQRKSMEP